MRIRPAALTTTLLVLFFAAPTFTKANPGQDKVLAIFADGTILVATPGGGEESLAVQLLGVEQYDFDGCPAPYLELGRRATQFLERILMGRSIVLRKDAGQPEKGPPCEDLRYIETDGGVFVNAEMLKQGYARVDRRFPLARLDELNRDEAMAREAGLGLWGLPERALSSGPSPPPAAQPLCGALKREKLACDETPGFKPPELMPRTRVMPSYPAKAYKLGKRITGTAVLFAAIREDGTVGDIHVIRSPGVEYGFDEVAVKALSKWRYKPALKNGKPVKIYFTVWMDFALK